MSTKDHSPIFELKHVTKSYGNNMAVKDGNLRIYPGEVHALMGGNGAGKSTMIKIIAGAHQADSGEILLDGSKVTFKHPKEAMGRGIQVVYQELSLLPHLTVSENIAMPSDDVVRHGIYDWKKSDALAEEALSRLGSATADISPHDIVSELRPDQMQMVEIARAVGQNAKIILLDEPTSSLNFEETEKLFESVRGLCNAGIGIIFVSHRMNEVRELSDRITILRDGVVIVDGVPMSEKTDEEIVSDMLGEKLNAEEKKRKDSNAFESSAEVLSISFDGYDGELTVKEGEIVGLAGLAGSGRSSVLRTIWGTKPRSDALKSFKKEFYCDVISYEQIPEYVEKADYAVISTPPTKRLDYVEMVLSKHVPLYLEKPIATTLEDAEKIVAMAKQYDAKIIVGFAHRFRPAFVKMYDMVKSGMFGDPVNVFSYRVGAGFGYGKNNAMYGNSWRTDPKLACGMTIESVSHEFNLLTSLAGEFDTIACNVKGTISNVPQLTRTRPWS